MSPTSRQLSTDPVAGRRKDMVWVPGGTFAMGSDDFYPEEAPVHQRTVQGFWIDEHPVTVAEFRRFVKATGYVTLAERPPDAELYPGAAAEDLVPGSLVFEPTSGPVPLDDWRRWWRWVPGASWRHPEGPASNVGGREHHPATHVGVEDAEAYARWAGKHLPTEAEWEFAARGGLDQAVYAWGDEFAPRGRVRANVWEGEFPWQRLNDRFARTSPVGAFPPNGYGLYDVTGNVWEWTADPWMTRPGGRATPGCCAPSATRSDDVQSGGSRPAIGRRVIKGGSHLCAENYCYRYRPAARQGEPVDTSTSHLGFRCIIRTGSDLEQPHGSAGLVG